MKLLIDTQIALWAISDDPKLSKRARALIEDEDTEIVVSVVSIWEVAIKHPLQRGSVNDVLIPGRRARELFEQSGFSILPVTAAHAEAVDDLPPLHGDPFDRMLIAQALTEPMHLVTHDRRLATYGALVTVV